jgi:hypothetical protein
MGGLSLKFKTEACSAEVFNFNEKPTMRFLCCLYLGTGHKVKGGGLGKLEIKRDLPVSRSLIVIL